MKEYEARRQVEVMQWYDQVCMIQHTSRMIIHMTDSPQPLKAVRLSLQKSVFACLQRDFKKKNSTDMCVQLPISGSRLKLDTYERVFTKFKDKLRLSIIDQIQKRSVEFTSKIPTYLTSLTV